MKLVAIGDVHGRDTWKQVNITAVDRVVFLGDYVDSRQGFSDDVIYQNLTAIIRLKQQNPDKLVLLIGNHDAQYLHYPDYGCTGFNYRAQPELTAVFVRHKDLFQMAYQQENYLFTHAGVSNGWYQYRKRYLDQVDAGASLADQLNAMHHNEQLSRFLFDVGTVRGGDEPYGGIVWADRSETIDDYLPGYHQVVGHTPIPDIKTVGDAESSITYCDVTQTRSDFYEINL